MSNKLHKNEGTVPQNSTLIAQWFAPVRVSSGSAESGHVRFAATHTVVANLAITWVVPDSGAHSRQMLVQEQDWACQNPGPTILESPQHR